VGDTITLAANPNPQMLQGFVEVENHGYLLAIFSVDTTILRLRDCMKAPVDGAPRITFELEKRTKPLVLGFAAAFFRIMLHLENTGRGMEGSLIET
jgi:translation elongation factor EF-4